MKHTKLFTKTIKETPKDEKSINAILLSRAGFIHKEMAGVYSFLPLGLRVLKKIEDIVRFEMNKIGAQEVLMTVFQPKSLWQKTNRWDQGIGKEVMYKCDNESIGLGPTHEEMLTYIVKNYIQSYEDLPAYIYQIQVKFRKELRAKSGLLRGREFIMKDLYSFHSSEKDFKEYYEKVKKAYFNIFKNCGLESILTEAPGGDFTKDITHEFQVLSEAGEDIIIYCPKFDFAQNKEITKFKLGQKCPYCKTELKQGKSIEVGNIFPLGDKYSKAIGALFSDKNSQRKALIMGCYGLGISRIMGTAVEVYHDKKGIIWPEKISPFKVHLLYLSSKDKEVKAVAEKLHNDLQEAGVEVLYDDRENKTAGEKFADADLIGIPYRLIISEKTIKEDNVELKKRDEDKVKMLKIKDLIKSI